MKVWFCFAVHLYYGPIGAVGTEVEEAVESCSQVTVERSRRAIERCAKEGSMRCEVLIRPAGKLPQRVVVEHKIEVEVAR